MIMEQIKMNLKFVSVIEIILAILHFIIIRFLLGKVGNIDVSTIQAEKDLIGLICLYGIDLLLLIAGVVGYLNYNKKSILTVIFGTLAILAEVWNLYTTASSGVNYFVIFTSCLLVCVQVEYLSDAIKLLISKQS